MKILLKILITIGFLITTVGSLALTVRNGREASAIAEDEAAAEAVGNMARMLGMSDAVGDIPSAGAFQFAMICSGILMLGSILGIVFAYVNNKKIGLAVAGIVILSGLLLVIFEPSIGGRLFSRNDPRPVGVTVGIIAIVVGGLLALLKAKFSSPAAPVDTTVA